MHEPHTALVAETILALERRAQAAEQRAMDLRLRYEFDKLRMVVTGRAMASEIAAMIEEAMKKSGTEQAVYERFAPAPQLRTTCAPPSVDAHQDPRISGLPAGGFRFSRKLAVTVGRG
jgi:hypothetical protein